MSVLFRSYAGGPGRIYNPETGGYAVFVNGSLELDESDPDYGTVMAEASRNPSIKVINLSKSGVNCPECGDHFDSAKHLSDHRQDAHFDAWLADKNAATDAVTLQIVKDRAGHACDVCQPTQVFGDEDGLALHMKVVHTQNGEQEEAAPAPKRRPGEVAKKA